MTRTSAHDDSSGRPANPRPAGFELKQRLDAWLDEALKQTFPASDPIASPPPEALSIAARKTRRRRNRSRGA